MLGRADSVVGESGGAASGTSGDDDVSTAHLSSRGRAILSVGSEPKQWRTTCPVRQQEAVRNGRDELCRRAIVRWYFTSNCQEFTNKRSSYSHLKCMQPWRAGKHSCIAERADRNGIPDALPNAALMSVWRVEMLGGLRAVRGDTTIERFPTRKTAALLGFLALSPGRFLPREILADALWPEASRETQLHNLRLTLSRLRRLFAPEALIEADRFAVRLDPGAFTTDVMELEQAAARRDMRRAKALWATPLLPGLYEDWISTHQARLDALWEQIEVWDGTAPPGMPLTLPKTLPLTLTRFFGRDADLKALQERCSEARLVTLTGPGGSGKTRLALEAARSWERVVFVPLADLTHSAQAADAVSRALRLPPPAPGFSRADQVRQEVTALAPLELIFDNAEHLLQDDSLANFVMDLLAATPALTVVVTSRRALGIPGEVVLPVPTLPPQDAITLFLDRARLARPGLLFGAENDTVTVQDLCHRLDGLPLALELAAARMSVLTPAEIRGNIERQRDFLKISSEVGVPRRHGSLRAAIQYSFDLLPPALQEQFVHLSIFRGGFTAEAARAVAGTDVDALEQLLHWSLVLPEEREEGALRFRLLETLRDFGQERLSEDEKAEVARRHAVFFCHWAEANRADDSRGPVPDSAKRFTRLEAEQDNVRAALAFCRGSALPADREIGLRLLVAFWIFWFLRNASHEMGEEALGLLADGGDTLSPLIRARALLTLSMSVRERGEISHFAALVEEAVAVLRTGPLDRHLAYGLHLRGLALADQQCVIEADIAYEEAFALWNQIGDRRNAATTRHNQALLALERGELSRAEILCEAALTVFQEWNEYGWAAVANLTWAGILAGRGAPEAEAAYRESIATYERFGYARGAGEAHRELSRYLRTHDRCDEAVRHASSSLYHFRRVGDRHGEATALLALTNALLGRNTPGDGVQAQSHYREACTLQARYRWPSLAPLLAEIATQVEALSLPPETEW